MTQVRLTAEDLQITDDEYRALIWTRDALDPSIPDTELPSWLKFEMTNWQTGMGAHQTLCNCYACIGGTMEAYLAGTLELPKGHVLTADEAYNVNHSLVGFYGSAALDPLFFQYNPDTRADRVKAVEAIDRFLAGNTDNPHQVRLNED